MSYNRDFIPKVLNISTIEESLLDSSRFPSLTSDQGLFTNSGTYHAETRVGYLVVVPGSGINTILANIGDATDGALPLIFPVIGLRMALTRVSI